MMAGNTEPLRWRSTPMTSPGKKVASLSQAGTATRWDRAKSSVVRGIPRHGPHRRTARVLHGVGQYAVEVDQGELAPAVDLLQVALDHDGAPAPEVVHGVVDGVGARAGVGGGVAAGAAPAGIYC